MRLLELQKVVNTLLLTLDFGFVDSSKLLIKKKDTHQTQQKWSVRLNSQTAATPGFRKTSERARRGDGPETKPA